MSWLEYIRTFWPIAVFILPFVCGAGFLWLKTQFPTSADLKGVETRIGAKIDAHDLRLGEGSRKLAELDKRIALVEDDCESSPSKQDLNQNYAVLAGRISGVESSLRALEKALSTLNNYVHVLFQKGLGG
jgi:chromosome segregation ATPase